MNVIEQAISLKKVYKHISVFDNKTVWICNYVSMYDVCTYEMVTMKTKYRDMLIVNT